MKGRKHRQKTQVHKLLKTLSLYTTTLCYTYKLPQTSYTTKTKIHSHRSSVTIVVQRHNVIPAEGARNIPILEPFLETHRVENMPARQLVYHCIWRKLCEADRALLLQVLRDAADRIIRDRRSSAAELLHVRLRGSSPAFKSVQRPFNVVLLPERYPDANDMKD